MVEVRPWEEIVSTLDATGRLDALPFMPEMRRLCGKRFVVAKRLARACDESRGEMRDIGEAIFLRGVRCDGSAHGGCQKRCYIFWKPEWLKVVNGNPARAEAGEPAPHDAFPFEQHLGGGRYVCQSTELIRASGHLPLFNVKSYLRDIRLGTYSAPALARILLYAAYLRLRTFATATSYRVLEGAQDRTPTDSLGLQPGDWVRVKSKDRIAATLDRDGSNRGLKFTVEMLPFCGGTFQVLARLEKMINEPTGRLVELKNTVILNDVVCDGCHIIRGGCPRENFHYWREIWLERVPAPSSRT